MRKLNVLPVMILSLILLSCGGSSESKYYEEAIFAEGGDFVGLSLGDSYEDVLAVVVDGDATITDDEYRWSLDAYNLSKDWMAAKDVSFYFDEDPSNEEKHILYSISYSYEFLDEGGDVEESKALYEKFKADLTTTYGESVPDGYEGDATGTAEWSKDGMDVLLSFNNTKTYVSITKD